MLCIYLAMVLAQEDEAVEHGFRIRKGLPFKNNELGLQLSDPPNVSLPP